MLILDDTTRRSTYIFNIGVLYNVINMQASFKTQSLLLLSIISIIIEWGYNIH